ncbi:MAG: GatB/YqeY domain-containing protein [Dehalococcoidia bacterium]|nr:GatB/YqeY domain-containing protein [Dehalococcoidia bacterium]
MSLQEKLADDQTAALRSGDQVRLGALRLLRSAIHYVQLESRGPLDDDAVLSVIGKQVKQRRESIEEFGKGNRPDLVAKEQAEMEILQTYLPPQASREDVLAIAREVIAETGARGKQDLGKVMPRMMSKLRGKADGRLISQVVQELLSQT